MVGKRMRREILPREPQVSVVTQTIYASSTSTATGIAIPTDDPGVPYGPIIGGMVGGMVLVLLVVGGWFWWGSRMRATKAKGAKARRAQHLTVARTHGKSESTETLHKSDSASEKSKSGTTPASEPVKMPSAILAEKSSPGARSPFNMSAPSTTSLVSKYAPARPSPLALAVVTRSPSVMSDNMPVPGPGSVFPAVNVVPPSPTMSTRALPVSKELDRTHRESVQTVASQYSAESAIGVAYGGDEAEQEALKNPRDEWLESKKNAVARIRPPPPMRR
ncbi:hypothetical protein RhiJN_14178 [Ceratobasidium sp. AG-Ba]|nr:hypothetical protein RhiJN_14178 [Ceratobasidium sp. AG-Ba]QRW14730.1 hypothetical protein RhiLY_13729 [Ceratobasidium sp. AG-Ba]